MKDELCEKITTKVVQLRAKAYSHLIDDVSEEKKVKWHEKVCHEKKT